MDIFWIIIHLLGVACWGYLYLVTEEPKWWAYACLFFSGFSAYHLTDALIQYGTQL